MSLARYLRLTLLTKHKALRYVFVLMVWGICSVTLASGQACIKCHASQVKAWQSSHHYHAMGIADAVNTLADFKNQTLMYQGKEIRFFTRDNSFFIRMPDLNGETRNYRVSHTFGYHPLQQFMFETAPGKFQFFPFAWDSRTLKDGGQRWFVLYPDVKSYDEFHWSQMGQNWNHMCAECHVTNYRKNFDPKTQKYNPSFSAINVSCEACHGDTQQHLLWAKQYSEKQHWDKQHQQHENSPKTVVTTSGDKGFEITIGAKTPLFKENEAGIMQSIATLKDSQQIEVCATCHSRRSALADRGEVHEFFQSYRPALITKPLYHADGQVIEEDYVWGSFLQSRMYQAGVSCSNCHDPHSGQIKFADNATGNGTCTQCHSEKKYDGVAHHRHKPKTSGSKCVDCHMPATTFMQVDARRDHSFPIPRPDLSMKFGVPNACTACHTDQDNEWADKLLSSWYPKSQSNSSKVNTTASSNPGHFSEAFYAADNNGKDAASKLAEVAGNDKYPAIIQASALSRMRHTPGRTPGQAPGQKSRTIIQQAIKDKDPLKRLAAINAAYAFAASDRWRLINTLLDDEQMSVRAEAGLALVELKQSLSLQKNDKQRLNKALADYVSAQSYQADRASAHTNLGNLALREGNIAAAIQHYNNAIKVEAIFMPAYVNLADIYRQQGNETKAQSILQQAIRVNPESDSALYALALSYVRQGNKVKALEILRKTANLHPENSQVLYAYGLMLQEKGDNAMALHQFKTAYQHSPAHPDILRSLVQAHLRENNITQALFYLRQLEQLQPENKEIKELRHYLEDKSI